MTLKTPSTTIGGINASADGTYHAALPPGTLQPGSFTLSSDPSAAVGAFQTPISFGQDIQVQTPAPAVGSTLPTNAAITLSWSGGDPNSTVTVFLISHYAKSLYATYCQALASVGQCTLLTLRYMNSVTTLSSFTESGEILYQIDPNPVVTPFSAPGLGLCGQATWRIQHSFQGFAIQ